MQYNIYQIPSRAHLPDVLIGKNARNILIVLEKGAFDTHADLLKKIMLSVGLDLEKDCMTLPLENADYLPLHQVRDHHRINNVLVFGDFFRQIGIQARIPVNTPFTFARLQFLKAAPLAELTRDQNKKRHLWNALKQIFQTAP